MLVAEKLRTAQELSADVLTDMFEGRCIVARVPNFYPPEYCKNLAESFHQQVEKAKTAGGGIYRSDIDAYWNVTQDDERADRYFGAAVAVAQRHRRLSAPHPSPIDLLRLALDEAWPGGATSMSVDGRKMPFGITRLWPVDSEALPHQDALWREVEPDRLPGTIAGQLGVNVYLDTADAGGELEVWDHVITDAEFEQLKHGYPGSYGYPREMLPADSLVVAPEIGDLILVNTLRAHAVRRITRGRRISISGFVAGAGIDRPLRHWS